MARYQCRTPPRTPPCGAQRLTGTRQLACQRAGGRRLSRTAIRRSRATAACLLQVHGVVPVRPHQFKRVGTRLNKLLDARFHCAIQIVIGWNASELLRRRWQRLVGSRVRPLRQRSSPTCAEGGRRWTHAQVRRRPVHPIPRRSREIRHPLRARTQPAMPPRSAGRPGPLGRLSMPGLHVEARERHVFSPGWRPRALEPTQSVPGPTGYRGDNPHAPPKATQTVATTATLRSAPGHGAAKLAARLECRIHYVGAQSRLTAQGGHCRGDSPTRPRTGPSGRPQRRRPGAVGRRRRSRAGFGGRRDRSLLATTTRRANEPACGRCGHPLGALGTQGHSSLCMSLGALFWPLFS